MTRPIILYDIPGYASPTKTWTPNVWKARLALNMKGIPYATTWVEYPDIANLCKKIGARPTGIRHGEPLYTMPVIKDPNTGTVVSESFNIAKYMDATYPDTLKLFPEGTKAFQTMFRDVFEEKVYPSLRQILALPTVRQLSPQSQAFWRKKTEVIFGKTVEEIAPEGPIEDKILEEMLEGLDTLHTWASQNKSGLFMMGDTPSFADVMLAAHLIWLRILAGADSKGWRLVMNANQGRWARFFDEFRKWYWVDEESVQPF